MVNILFNDLDLYQHLRKEKETKVYFVRAEPNTSSRNKR